MISFLFTVFLLFPIIITNSSTVHSTSCHIAYIQIPNINNLQSTQTCTYSQLNIKSLSFLNLNQFDIPTSLTQSHHNYNYTQYNLQTPITILPTQLHNIILNIHITINNTQNTFCGPKNIVVPIMNTDIKVKCLLQKWNAMTNIMQYKCNPSIILPSTPSATTFYSIDNEYISALQSYKQQRRKLFYSNDTKITGLKQTNSNSKENINPLMFLILIVPFTLCIFGIYAITKKRKKNNHSESSQLKIKNHKTNNMSNNSHNKPPNVSKYIAIPITENQLENTQFNRERFIEMTNCAHEINNSSYSNSNSDIETETQSTKTPTDVRYYNQKRNSIVHDDSEQIRSPKNGKNTKNGIHFLRNLHSLPTDTFDIVPSESLYSLTTDEGRSYKESGYDNDNEQIDDVTFSPIHSSQLPSKYTKVLPDDEEPSVSDDSVVIMISGNNGHRDSYYCGSELRKDSGDIDYDKLEINSWGTSLPLHGGLIEGKEELSKHKFFYNAPKIKKKKKTSKFKQRIKDDATLNKELEDDIINQMITDSEMSAAEWY